MLSVNGLCFSLFVCKPSECGLFYLYHPQGVCSRLEEGASNEEQFGHLVQRCCHKLMSLQERISACQGQKENSAGTNTDIAALEVRCIK